MAGNRFGRHEFQGVCEQSERIGAAANDYIMILYEFYLLIVMIIYHDHYPDERLDLDVTLLGHECFCIEVFLDILYSYIHWNSVWNRNYFEV